MDADDRLNTTVGANIAGREMRMRKFLKHWWIEFRWHSMWLTNHEAWKHGKALERKLLEAIFGRENL